MTTTQLRTQTLGLTVWCYYTPYTSGAGWGGLPRSGKSLPPGTWPLAPASEGSFLSVQHCCFFKTGD